MSFTKRIKRDQACNLLPEERDRYLLKGGWPNVEGLEKRWQVSPGGTYLSRTLFFVDAADPRETEASKDVVPETQEAVVRFPNAPVYNTHHSRPELFELEKWPNYHTMRILRRKDLSVHGAKQIFLLHNGLNETKDLGFHYCLANWILSQCEDAACIIRPLPDHFSRYPFQGSFTERPLDKYLLDPARLFRQFLRYMLETQWLLSAVVPRNDYKVSTGCDLLLYEVEPGRESSDALAREITIQANRALEVSEGAGSHSPERLLEPEVKDCVTTVRELIGWTPIDPATPPRSTAVDAPSIHAVGYSMGGFMAQAIFCTWPYVVGSCSNLFAGGALRDLAPTAFAHPEEWQSVMHGLRSELDQTRVDDYFKPQQIEDEGLSPGSGYHIAGIEKSVFDYFSHVFDDVFVQANAGSYSTRLAEFSRRLLFILGGDDPIVRTRKVLDAAPPGGVTMHQIGDMSHFPSKRKSEPAEKEQRDFWLPEAGKVIGRFAMRAATLLQQTNSRCWLDELESEDETLEDERVEPDMPLRPTRSDWVLPNMRFERELDAVVSMINDPDPGWLFIARNQVPLAFLGDAVHRAYGAAMHHAEDLIDEYVRSIGLRAKQLTKKDGRVSLLIPGGLVTREYTDLAHSRSGFSKSESAMRIALDFEANREAWKYFEDNWRGNGAVHVVDAREYEAGDLEPIGPLWAEKRNGGKQGIAIGMLPDVWMAFSGRACRDLFGVEPSMERERIEGEMVKVACQLLDNSKMSRGEHNLARNLHDMRMAGAVRTVEVSGAELNPRYRGRVLDDMSEETVRTVNQLIVHWAMARQAAWEYEALPNSSSNGSAGS